MHRPHCYKGHLRSISWNTEQEDFLDSADSKGANLHLPICPSHSKCVSLTSWGQGFQSGVMAKVQRPSRCYPRGYMLWKETECGVGNSKLFCNWAWSSALTPTFYMAAIYKSVQFHLIKKYLIWGGHSIL